MTSLVDSKIHFITFYSQGIPHDTGLDLSETEKEVKTKVSPYVDTFTAYHPKDLDDDEFSWSVKDWTKIDEKYMRHKQGWWSPHYNKHVDINNNCDKTGFFAWKSAIILKKMREIPDGDIIFYHDGNFNKRINFPNSKYPYYVGMKEWKTLIKKILHNINSDIFIPWEQNHGLQPIRRFCRKTTFEKLASFTDYYTKFDCLWAGFIVMRKSEKSKQFLYDVIKGMKDIDCISNYPIDNSPDLKWHTWDQPVWTIIARKYIKENKLPKNWPMYYMECRTFSSSYVRKSNQSHTPI